jgi:hypothetical protein
MVKVKPRLPKWKQERGRRLIVNYNNNKILSQIQEIENKKFPL